MCGIVGYIGNKIVDVELVKTLKNLEYRGYDSAGVALQCKTGIETIKSVGKISNLQKILPKQKGTKCGIAHTRWATHGAATIENAHPHVSNNKTWAVVHNGIIENFAELKKNLEKLNYTFYSQTDTEVIANLLQNKDSKSKINTLIETCQNLKGSYALACLCSAQKNTLFLAKKKSPLYVAQLKGEVIVASDPICFADKTNCYYSLNDDEFCMATKESIIFYNKLGEIIQKDQIAISEYELSPEKNEYPHYMLKEINETQKVLFNIAKIYKEKNILKNFNKQFVNRFDKIVIVGCGTAYHASLMGARYLEDLCRLNCSAHMASEFRYQNPIIDKKTLCILVSQSGETADTLAVNELVKENGATTIALTNVLYSTLAKNVDIVLPVCAGPEIAVASTKAYTAQISIFYILANKIRNVLFKKHVNYLKNIVNLSKNIEMFDSDGIKDLSAEISKENKVFFIGRNFDHINCEEASLKLKEISYINCASHPAGELKHGFLALVEENTHVFVLATKKSVLNKTLNGAHEALSRGAKIILITNSRVDKEETNNFYKVIKIKRHAEYLMPIASIVPFQLLAYYTSVNKSLNPDKPRNLAKSVTVE